MTCREAFRDRRLAADGQQNILPPIGGGSPGLDVPRRDVEGIEWPGLVRGWRDREHLCLVFHHVVEVARTPSQVVLVFDPCGQEGAQVGELDQTTILVQVVEECEVRPRVSQAGQILNEGDLHLRPGQEHACVPGKARLLLQKQDLGHMADSAGLERVVKRNCNGQAGGTKADADEVVDGVRIRSS